MSDKRIMATTKVEVVLEIDNLGPWDATMTTAELFRSATRDAVNRINNLFASDKIYARNVRIVRATPKSVVAEEEGR